jgi:hypothetical protein
MAFTSLPVGRCVCYVISTYSLFSVQPWCCGACTGRTVVTAVLLTLKQAGPFQQYCLPELSLSRGHCRLSWARTLRLTTSITPVMAMLSMRMRYRGW